MRGHPSLMYAWKFTFDLFDPLKASVLRVGGDLAHPSPLAMVGRLCSPLIERIRRMCRLECVEGVDDLARFGRSRVSSCEADNGARIVPP